MSSRKLTRVEGRGLSLRGHDIDTDRIIPARFLRAVRFEGLEQHVFEDDRASWPAGQGQHPFDDPRYAGAKVLLVNRNFGCGSSREHAPQAIVRWGIAAIIGESFSEIFFGNSVALGLPCLTAAPDAADRLQSAIEGNPAAQIVVDVAGLRVQVGSLSEPLTMPSAAHEALVTGNWDATGLLLEDYAHVEGVAKRIPYLNGFRVGA
ncbi:MAG: 3-isopropylmalate dehydratase small subunit 2 [Vicinamibacterales bacterium]